MKVRKYVDEVMTFELDDLKDKTLEDLILKFHAKNLKRLYIVKNKKPIAVISPKEIISIFLNKEQAKNAYEYFKDKEDIRCFRGDENIVDVYYKMRKENISFIPVCDNGQIIGELDFDTLSLKISYIIVKDELTHVYNRKYFEVLMEEYNDFSKPLGIIFISIENLPVYEGLYGIEMGEKIIKGFADTIVRSVRKIDFVFRWDNEFRIITFNDLEKTTLIYERIKKNLSELEIDSLKIPFDTCIAHVPELQGDIFCAIEECEEKLIKRH